MLKDSTIQELTNLIQGKVSLNEPMKKHTTFKIGGPAEVFILPEDKEDVRRIILYCLEHQVPWYVIGNGSNILVKDEGICGIVVKISGVIADIGINGQQVRAGGGVFLPGLAKQVAKCGLSGLEHTIGIPGTLGGAITQNAGSSGKQIGQVVKRVEVLTKEGEIKELETKDLNFGYRTSIFKQTKQIILEAELELKRGQRQEIEAEMATILKERRQKLPLSYPNAGCIFKNPPKGYAARLIELAGCNGLCCGGAQISPVHANFIVNRDKATFKDVMEIIKMVQDKVFLKFNLELEPEIVIL